VIKNTYQWPKFNKGFIFFGFFILTLTISSIFGGYFLLSFWSTFERMDGLVNWYHILLYVVVLLGVNRTIKDWQILFHTSLLVAVLVALYALGQALGLSFLMSSAGGQRLSSTLGNAAYVGSYLFLHIVIASYFLFKKIQNKNFYSWPVLYYVLGIIIFTIVLLATETRGALLGLLSFVFLLTLAYLYYERHKKTKFYYLVISLLVALILFFVAIFVQRDSAWVRSMPIFYRLTHVSLTDTTTQSRLLIWQNSLTHAFVAKPILGWGEENFADAFNKYFPSAIFVSLGSEIWFDRPHNILIQHLVHGGLLGLGFYLAIFVYLLWSFWRQIRQGQPWLWPVFWSAFLLGFLVQDFFIFLWQGDFL
jgi:O-antigen ligase